MTEYNPSDDAKKCYELAVEAKRERGDTHWPDRLPYRRKEVIGDCTLYLGDCMEIMPTLGEVDAVITDPPYGEQTHDNAKSNRNGGSGKKAINFAAIDAATLKSLISDCAKLSPRWFVSTMEWRHIVSFEQEPPEGWDFVRFGVWVKTNPMPQISADRPAQGWEGIIYLHNPASGKKAWNGGGSHGNWIGSLVTDGAHPTGKPVAMFQSFVERFTDNSETVLDPFMGSGTTGVACAKAGRSFVGIEQHEPYFEIACERIRKAYAQPDMFVQAAPVAQPKQEPLL